MASKKDTQRALSGALKLLPPADKISDSDASELTNWRSDTENELRTRKGSALECSIGGSGVFHTLRKVGVYRLAGLGTKLWGGAQPTVQFADQLDGQPLGMAFYQSVPIVPFSGETSQGIAWIMNRARQLRLAQTDAYKWGTDAPTTAPVATASGPSQIVVDAYDGSDGNDVQATADGVTWTDVMTADAPVSNDLVTASYVTDPSIDATSSLQLVVNGAMSVQQTKDLGSFDSRIAGAARDDDTFYLEVYLTDPTHIASMAVELVDVNGARVSVPFVVNSPLDPKKILNQNPNSWSQLAIRRTVNVDSFMQQIEAAKQLALAGDQQQSQIATDLSAQLALFLQQPYFNVIAGRDPSILGITTPLRKGVDFDWTQVATFQVNFVCSDAVQINLDNCVFTGVDGVALTGEVTYWVSFFDWELHDGNPSPASNALTVINGTVTLTSVPTWTASGYNPSVVSGTPGDGKSAQVRGRWIYRSGGGLSAPLRVGVIWDNTTTTWIDTTTNRQAQALGEFMPTNRNLPPPARGCFGPYLGKIIAFNSDAHPARFWWTESGLAWFFPGSDDDASGNWEDAGGDDDHIVNGTEHKSLFVLYKQRSIWRLRGDPDDNDSERTNANVGLIGPNAVVNAGSIDYFGGPEGVYSFNMDFETKLSGDIDPIFKGDYVLLSTGEYLPPVNKTAMDTCCIGLTYDRLRYNYPEVGHGTPNVCAVLNLSTGKWSREKYTALNSPAFTAMNNDGPSNMMGGAGTSLYRIEQDDLPTDAGGAITVLWQSRFFDQGLPDIFKHYSDVEIEFQTATRTGSPATLTLSIVYNNEIKVSLGTISSATRTTAIFPLRAILAAYQNAQDEGLLAKNIAIRLEGSVSSECVVYGAFIHWYPEERLALSFDTGFTDLGIAERVKQVDHFEYYETGTGAAQLRNFYSDLPGRILTQRLSETVAEPIGRGTIRQRLTSVIEGRNFRLTFGSTGPFQMHAIRARMRPIGEYIDGTNGEYYESPEFSIAPGRVGELKDFILDYDVSAAGGRMDLYTDLPGTALTVRRSLPIPAQTTRGVYVFPLELGSDTTSDYLPAGQMFKVRLYPPPGGILRLHGRAVFRGRVIGVYFNGGNAEVFQTQPMDLLGGMGIFREMSVVAQTSGAMTVTLETELPNVDMQPMASVTLNPSLTTAGRAPAFFRLPGNTKGLLQRIKVSGTAITRLFEIKLLARKLQLNGSGWEWVSIPMDPTADAFAEIAMPVRSTPEAFDWVEIPVDVIE